MLREALSVNKKKTNNVWPIRCDSFEKYEFKLARYVIGAMFFIRFFQ